MLHNRYHTFLLATGACLVLLMTLSVALCVYADPYRMFGTERTTEKPFIYARAGLAKTYMIERIRPNTLILGGATAETGLDPESDVWSEDLKPVFNASGQDVDSFMALRLLQHDVAVKPPRLVVLELNFLEFLKPQSDGPQTLRQGEKRLLVDRAGRPNSSRGIQLWRDFFANTLTRQAISDSIGTLLLQNRPGPTIMTEFGFNPAQDYEKVLHRLGQETIFSRNDLAYRAQFREVLPFYFHTASANIQFRSLVAMARLADKKGLRLAVFIPPYHSRYLEIIHDTGLWESFESWKRALVETLASANLTNPHSVTLYDFSGYDDISGERVPQPGDTQAEMRWYRDSIHYTSALGDLMIAAILGIDAIPGRILNTDTVEASLQHVRDSRDQLFAPVEIRR